MKTAWIIALVFVTQLVGKESHKEEDSEENFDNGSTNVPGGVFSPTERPSNGLEVTNPPTTPSTGGGDFGETDEGSTTTDPYTEFQPPTVNPLRITSTVRPRPPANRPPPVNVVPVITYTILLGNGCFSQFGRAIKNNPRSVKQYNFLFNRLRKCLRGKCYIKNCTKNLGRCLKGQKNANGRYDCWYKWYLCIYKQCDHSL